MSLYYGDWNLAQEWTDRTSISSFGTDEGLPPSKMGTWWWGEFLKKTKHPCWFFWIIFILDLWTLPRTKRFLSDGHWQPKTILILPASVARSVNGNTPPGWASSGLGVCRSKWQCWNMLRPLSTSIINYGGDPWWPWFFGGSNFTFAPCQFSWRSHLTRVPMRTRPWGNMHQWCVLASTFLDPSDSWSFILAKNFWGGLWDIATRSRALCLELHSWCPRESVHGYLRWTLCWCVLAHGSVNNLCQK